MAPVAAPTTVLFHNPTGPVGTLASGHLGATYSNTAILEYAFGEVPWPKDCITPDEAVAAGVFSLPTWRGLGARLNGYPLASTRSAS